MLHTCFGERIPDYEYPTREKVLTRREFIARINEIAGPAVRRPLASGLAPSAPTHPPPGVAKASGPADVLVKAAPKPLVKAVPKKAVVVMTPEERRSIAAKTREALRTQTDVPDTRLAASGLAQWDPRPA